MTGCGLVGSHLLCTLGVKAVLLREALLKMKWDKLELGLRVAPSGEASVCAGVKSLTLKSLSEGRG